MKENLKTSQGAPAAPANPGLCSHLQNQDLRQTVLITGATGFLGEYLVRRLTGEYRVLALGRNRERGRKLEAMGAVFCPGDFTDTETCSQYFKDVEYVIHAGALSSVWGKWEDFYHTNVTGTNVVAKLCSENGIRRLVYISSPSVYTCKKDQYHIREEQAPGENNLNFYIRSKLLAEEVIQDWHKKGLETVILRPRGLIGIGDTSLVPRLMRANSRIGIPLFRGGGNLIDLTCVENAAEACRLALTAEKAPGGIFNITNGEPAKFRTLLEQFLEASGESPHYRNLPFPLVYGMAAFLEWLYRFLKLPGEPPLTRYTVCTLGFAQTMDISRARELLGYRPQKTLAQSIQEYGRWQKGIPESPGLVEKASLYHCGSCTNRLDVIFAGMPRKKRKFPASAVLIRHSRLGNILFDTGYSRKIFQGKPLLKLYRFMNPVSVKAGETIAEKLRKDGINPADVKTIILSHAHPDHCGGLYQFTDYELIASRQVLETLRRPSARKLVFKSLLPSRKSIRRMRLPGVPLKEHFLCRYFTQVYDLFEDGSIIGVSLPGHCAGQLGIWIPDLNLFLAADACWGRDFVRAVPRMRLIPRLIQDSFHSYEDTLGRICRMKKEHPEIKVVFTHQRGKEKTYG